MHEYVVHLSLFSMIIGCDEQRNEGPNRGRDTHTYVPKNFNTPVLHQISLWNFIEREENTLNLYGRTHGVLESKMKS